MASTTQRGDEKRSKRPAAQSDRVGPDQASRATDDRGTQPYQKGNRSPQGPQADRSDPSDKDLPDDGGTETDRGAVVKQDRNFDSGPTPGRR